MYALLHLSCGRTACPSPLCVGNTALAANRSSFLTVSTDCSSGTSTCPVGNHLSPRLLGFPLNARLSSAGSESFSTSA